MPVPPARQYSRPKKGIRESEPLASGIPCSAPWLRTIACPVRASNSTTSPGSPTSYRLMRSSSVLYIRSFVVVITTSPFSSELGRSCGHKRSPCVACKANVNRTFPAGSIAKALLVPVIPTLPFATFPSASIPEVISTLPSASLKSSPSINVPSPVPTIVLPGSNVVPVPSPLTTSCFFASFAVTTPPWCPFFQVTAAPL